MTRKQARRKKQTRKARFRMPRIRVAHLIAPVVAVGVVFGTYTLSASMLDRPIRSIEISGPFQRVSALKIEEAISNEINAGFLGADLDRIQARVAALQWIDRATVARRWPSRISITVTEQVPAAVWGDSGLLNTRGELFVSESRRPPPELPRLSGPDGQSAEVAAHYLDVRDQLIPRGLDLRRVHLDARGSWQMSLANGIEIRLGRRSVAERTRLFLDVAADIIASRSQEIAYVDMRYGNGFTIGWAGAGRPPADSPEGTSPEMLAARDND